MAKDASRRTSTSTTEIPEWLTDASQNAISSAQSFYEQGFTPFTGNRVAGLSPDTFAGQDALRDLQYNHQPVSTERIVDEGGRLGAISDYFNPHTDMVMDQVQSRMQEEADRRQSQISMRRLGHGAYGDARHGVEASEAHKGFQRALGETTAGVYSNAYNSAMSQRGGDLARFFQGDLANQQGEQSRFAAEQQRIQGLLASGQMTQQQAQNELDSVYNEYLREQQDAYDRLAALVGSTGGVPFSRATTDVAAPGYPLMQILGAFLGASNFNFG